MQKKSAIEEEERTKKAAIEEEERTKKAASTQSRQLSDLVNYAGEPCNIRFLKVNFAGEHFNIRLSIW